MDKSISYLIDIVKSKRITQRDIAQALGVNEGHLSKVLAGKAETSRQLALSIQSFVTQFETNGDYSPRKSSGNICHALRYFYLSGAGNPASLHGEPAGEIMLPNEFDGKDVTLIKIQGDSMQPTIMDRAIIGIDSSEAGRKVVSGQVYAVWVEWEGSIVKRVFLRPEGVILKSDNPNHAEIIVKHDEVSILGRMIWSLNRY